ncbi:MAG: YbbR-like domain-containing protein [Prevotellaceae bacterium]|nr:YbbR-like domain-containing protein [Prevotellaceae bacterium]
MLFVVISTGFWYFQNLYKENHYDFRLPLKFTHIPVKYVSAEDLPDALDLTLADLGAVLISYRVRQLDTLVISLRNHYRKGDKNIVIPTQSLLPDIKRLLKNSTEVVKIKENQLVIPLIEQQEKIVPVILNADISYSQQYILSGEIKLSPSVATVYGPRDVVDTLAFVFTEHAVFENLSKNTTRLVPLQKISSLRILPQEVTINIPVEAFTEQSIELPIIGKNLPNTVTVLPFPSTVKVLYFVSLSHINDVDGSAFEVFYDYNDLQNNDLSRLPLYITVKYPYLQNVRIVPNEVEYLIEK